MSRRCQSRSAAHRPAGRHLDAEIAVAVGLDLELGAVEAGADAGAAHRAAADAADEVAELALRPAPVGALPEGAADDEDPLRRAVAAVGLEHHAVAPAGLADRAGEQAEDAAERPARRHPGLRRLRAGRPAWRRSWLRPLSEAVGPEIAGPRGRQRPQRSVRPAVVSRRGSHSVAAIACGRTEWRTRRSASTRCRSTPAPSPTRRPAPGRCRSTRTPPTSSATRTTPRALFNLQEVGFIYSRLTNPTVMALAERLVALEGGVGGGLHLVGARGADHGAVPADAAGRQHHRLDPALRRHRHPVHPHHPPLRLVGAVRRHRGPRGARGGGRRRDPGDLLRVDRQPRRLRHRHPGAGGGRASGSGCR